MEISVYSERHNFYFGQPRLAAAHNEELLAAAYSTSFSDIFDYIVFGTRFECPDDTRAVNIRSTPECLALKPGQEKLAAFFETRRYAAYMGATTEWGNLRGIVYDPQSTHLFMSVTRVDPQDTIMLQDSKGSPNHLRVGLAPCGCLFRLPVEVGIFNATKLVPHVCGRSDTGTNSENRCNQELISNPGYISLIPGQRKLLVSENSCKKNADTTRPSTCGHTNNVVWALNPFDRTDLTRLATVPYKTKPSSASWTYDMNVGGGIIQFVVNEPYDNGNDAKVDDKDSTGSSASFGYLGPLTERVSEFLRTCASKG